MTNRLTLLALVFALTLNFSASAKDATKREPYFPLETIDYKTLLPEPPALKSDANQKELDSIVDLQKALTPEQLADIKLEGTYNTGHIFQDIVGAWFTKENVSKLPALQRLLKREAETTALFVTAAKEHWKRLRPYQQDTRIHSPIGPVDGWSYPSGHSTRGTVDADVLAQVDPGAAEALLQRGRRIGDDRVLAGVHFQTDVDAGRIFAKAIFDQLMANPDFQADLAKAKVEVAEELRTKN
jgi:acid phosphatase (class A)